MRTISSQKYLDESIVEKKRENEDYVAFYVIVEIEDEEYRVVVDGHHSIAAAKADGVKIEWELATQELVNFAASNPDDFMLQHQLDSDWYDIKTGLNVWQ
jgi:hypothetical protein